MVDWARQRTRFQLLLAFCLCIMIGAGMALVIGRTEAPAFWIIYGGNTDPGDGNGNGLARQQFIDGGWTSPENSFQVTWKADISSGTNQEVKDAVPAGVSAVNEFCKSRTCIYAGFSLGTMPALALSKETNHPAELTYLFGGPQPSTGIWHNQYLDNPGIQPWLGLFGQLDANQVVAQGTKNFYDTRDPYNNAAPQCSGPGLFALTLDGHRIIRKDEADQHVWVGTDGVEMHEANYTGPIGLPASGADPSQFWAGCELNDWHNTPNSPGAQTNPDDPKAIIPGGSPIPSQEGNMPQIPGLPTGG